MQRRTPLYVLWALALLGTLALFGLVHAQPSETGDWEITRFESYEDADLTVNGSIIVRSGGTLVLEDVNVRFDVATAPNLTVEPGGSLSIEGGRFETSRDSFEIYLLSPAKVNGTEFWNPNGIYVRAWGVTVTNITTFGTLSSAVGIDVAPDPLDPPISPIVICDNELDGADNEGIKADINTLSPGTVQLVISGNNVSYTNADGIYVNVDAGNVVLMMGHNRVNASVGNGLLVSATANDLKLDLEGTVVMNTGMLGTRDGIRVHVDTPVLDLRMDNVTVRGSTGYGVSLSGRDQAYGLSFSGWNVSENDQGGVHLFKMMGTIIRDSYIYNLGSIDGDYWVYSTTLDIYGTFHQKAEGKAAWFTDHITSHRSVDIHAQWQNGAPCAGATIELRDGKGALLRSGVTDASGWWGNHTFWEWNITQAVTEVRDTVKPTLSIGGLLIPGNDLTFDRAIELEMKAFDDVLPEIDIVEYYTSSDGSSTKLDVKVDASDEHSGVGLVQVSIDPDPDWASKDWSDATFNIASLQWEVVLTDVPEGLHIIFARAFDVANLPDGEFAGATDTVLVDITAPTITVIAPAALEEGDLLVNVAHLTLEVSVDDDTEYASVNDEEVPLQAIPPKDFTVLLTLQEGENLIDIIVIDGVGNRANRTLRVFLDLTGPSLVITNPEDGNWTRNSSIEVNGTTDPDGVRVYVNGEEATVVDGVWSHTMSLAPGSNPVTVEAIDDAGNRRVEVVTVNYDIAAPDLEVTEPDGPLITNDPRVTIQGTVDEALQDDMLTVDGVPVMVVGGSFVLELGPFADGQYDIEAVAIDLAGNSASVIVHVVVDTVAPWVADVSLQEGLITRHPVHIVTGTLEEGAQLKVDGVPAEVTDGTFTIEITLDEGYNAVTLTARDAAGNSVTVFRNVTLDTIPPELLLEGISEDRIVVDYATFSLGGRTDADAFLTLTIAGADVEVTVYPDGTFSHLIELVVGETPVRVTATDIAGNQNHFEVVFVRNVTGEEEAPAGLLDSPAPAVVAVAVPLIIIAAMAAVETTKYSLVLLLLPLYARLRKREILDNKTRYALHGLIIENPGLHYNGLIREFGLTNGVAAYHLDVLEREGFIRSVRDGTLRRFYSTTTKVPGDRKLPPEALREEIIRLVDGHPDISQKQIVDFLGIGRTLAGYHISLLVKEGYLEAKRRGRFTVYNRTGRRWNF